MSRRLLAKALLVLILVGFSLSFATERAAARDRRKPAWQRPTSASALVVDAETGTVLYQKKPYAKRAPASLVKMMLELLVFEAIDRGQVNWDDRVRVPREASRIRGSRVGLRTGEIVTVRDLMAATAIASGNDAATALGIHLAGSTAVCVEQMNRRARELGMNDTDYVNVHGLDHGGRPITETTAWDQAILARELIRIPEALRLSSTVAATIRGGQTIRTTNHLLTRFPGIDGLKTGTTGRAGYCLVATSERNGWRLISVVLGATNTWRRFDESASLLYDAFLNWQRVRVVSKGEDLGERLAVRQGELDWVRLLAGRDIEVIIPTRRRREIDVAVATPPSTRAPVAKGWTLGDVQVFIGDSLAASCRAVAGHAVARTDRPRAGRQP